MGAERTITLTAVAALVAATLVAPVGAAEVVPAELHHGSWQLETPLGRVAGPLLVVAEDAGAWRCEIALAEDRAWPSREALLGRRGRGWTITGTPDGSFVQPWSEPWRELGPAAAGAFAELLDRWSGGDATARTPLPRRRRWQIEDRPAPTPVILDDWAGLPAAWRPPGEGTAAGGELRRRLTARGRGRGGDGLVLDLHREAGDLIATSARWPGRVVLRREGAEPVEVPLEAFLPLWPLAEFIR